MTLIGKQTGGKVGLPGAIPAPTSPHLSFPPPPAPDVNTFTIRSHDPDIDFRALFGDGAPTVIDGYGGWSVVNRPQTIGITEWIGRNPMAIEIPFVIDKWISTVSQPGVEVERMANRLERLCGLGSHDEPPVCKVNGKGVIPHDEFNDPDKHKWVVENVTWDRAIELRSGDTQRRLRCGGTLVIRQFVQSDPLVRRKKKSAKPSIYIVKRGDTLLKIAAKVYGAAKKWKKIGDANDIRDPRKVLKEGRHLRIPRP